MQSAGACVRNYEGVRYLPEDLSVHAFSKAFSIAGPAAVIQTQLLTANGTSGVGVTAGLTAYPIKTTELPVKAAVPEHLTVATGVTGTGVAGDPDMCGWGGVANMSFVRSRAVPVSISRDQTLVQTTAQDEYDMKRATRRSWRKWLVVGGGAMGVQVAIALFGVLMSGRSSKMLLFLL